jgi:crotonobetainyl-CoA:carnitine CoA-transferase CaiB-like acyl-CoA transferase
MNLESLRNVNPQIIYSRVSAYGDRGPEAFRAGFDVVSQSGAGTMVAGPDGKMPAPEKIPIGDVTGFCLETIGILAALYHRKITGEAQAVSTSMLAGSLLQNILRMVSVDRTDCEWRSEAISRSRELIRGGAPYRDVLRATATASGGEPQSRDRNDPMVAVYYRTYHTKDGYIAVGCRNLRQQRRLNELLSLGDPRFEPGANRNSLTTPEAQQRRSRMAGKADAEFASRSTAEMLEILEAGEIACGPIVTTLETFDSRQLLENEYVVEQVHPGFGPTKLLGFPISFEKTPMRISRPAPAVGSDGDEVMAWLGYDQERVRDLRARQIVC